MRDLLRRLGDLVADLKSSEARLNEKLDRVIELLEVIAYMPIQPDPSQERLPL